MEEPSVGVIVFVDFAFASQNDVAAHSELVFEQSTTISFAELRTNQKPKLLTDDSVISETLENIEVVLSFEVSEAHFQVERTQSLIEIRLNCVVRVDQKPKHIVQLDESSEAEVASKTTRSSLSLADRDQLRAMIVMLNESNGVLLKIRQRFPLTASTRCDVIQRQIQLQLQELFAEFRTNDVANFRALIPRNREAFLLIWDHLSQLIVNLCYHD